MRLRKQMTLSTQGHGKTTQKNNVKGEEDVSHGNTATTEENMKNKTLKFIENKSILDTSIIRFVIWQ